MALHYKPITTTDAAHDVEHRDRAQRRRRRALAGGDGLDVLHARAVVQRALLARHARRAPELRGARGLTARSAGGAGAGAGRGGGTSMAMSQAGVLRTAAGAARASCPNTAGAARLLRDGYEAISQQEQAAQQADGVAGGDAKAQNVGGRQLAGHQQHDQAHRARALSAARPRQPCPTPLAALESSKPQLGCTASAHAARIWEQSQNT